MPLRKLSSTNAFVVTDLADAPSAGIVRSAPKILQGGARDLARSLTYSFATFGVRRGGASAGINASDDERTTAVEAFVAELTEDVASGNLALDAGKGVDPAALEPLTRVDGRHPGRHAMVGDDDLRTHLAGLGPAYAADTAVGLQGRTVAIEGFGTHGPALAEAVEARGGRIVGVSTSGGALLGERSASDLREGWNTLGDGLVGGEAPPPWKIFQTDAEVLFVGSRMAAVDHVLAAKLEIAALVPHEPLPYTTRALAVLQRAGTKVLPDFVTTAGPIFADWPTGGPEPADVVTTAAAAIAEVLLDTADHPEGLFLAACYRAESFLSTWQPVLPFGRPLAG